MNLVIGKRYILSEKININNVGGGFRPFAKELQINSHVLINKVEFTYSKNYFLIFKKEFPEEFTYPTNLRINTFHINSILKNKGFILDKQEVAKIIQKLFKEKQIKQKTPEELYAPEGPAYNIGLKCWIMAL